MRVAVDVAVRVAVAVDVEVRVAVDVEVGVRVTVTLPEGTGDSVAVRVRVGVDEAVTVGLGGMLVGVHVTNGTSVGVALPSPKGRKLWGINSNPTTSKITIAARIIARFLQKVLGDLFTRLRGARTSCGKGIVCWLKKTGHSR